VLELFCTMLELDEINFEGALPRSVATRFDEAGLLLLDRTCALCSTLLTGDEVRTFEPSLRCLKAEFTTSSRPKLSSYENNEHVTVFPPTIFT